VNLEALAQLEQDAEALAKPKRRRKSTAAKIKANSDRITSSANDEIRRLHRIAKRSF
jgi:hypothetical protein